MLFYAMQVRTGKEQQYGALARGRQLVAPETLIWPRRRLRIRRGGEWKDSLAPLFPGDLFLRANEFDDIPWRHASQPARLHPVPSGERPHRTPR